METASFALKDRIQAFERYPASALQSNPGNWRTHPKSQQDALSGVLRSIGIAGALTAYRSERHGGRLTLIDGHARSDGFPDTEWPVLVLDLTDEEADALLASYDVLTKMAVTDEAAFQRLVEEAVKRADSDLQEALITLAKFEGITIGNQNPLMDAPDLAPVPGVPEDPVTQPGDIWVLGQHRLICGDSSDSATLDRLLRADMIAGVWTDPPYGVSYGMKQRDLNKFDKGRHNEDHIQNDGVAEAIDLFKRHLAVLVPAMMPGCPYYVAHPHGPISVEFGAALLASGLLYHQTLIWAKDSMVLGHSDYHYHYHYQHEPVAYGWKPENMDQDYDYDDGHTNVVYGWKRQQRAKRPWYAGRKQVSIFQTERPVSSKEHPTMKPVALIEHHLRNSTKPGDIVFDGFAGSGSTLIAAERLGRHFRGVELDPGYCDIIVLRWQDLTGQEGYRHG